MAPLTWRAGAGKDTLKVDYSAATQGIFTSATAGNYSIHALQWADLAFFTVYDVEVIDITG